jgi:transcriptional regulator with XRE-family HTH domain
MARIAAGRSQRELARVTRENDCYVNASSIGDLMGGFVSTFEILEKLAEGLDLSAADRVDLFSAAEFPSEDVISGADAFYEEFRRLQADYPHLPIPLPHFSGGVRSIKGPDEAREIVAGMRRRVEQGLFGDPRRPVM